MVGDVADVTKGSGPRANRREEWSARLRRLVGCLPSYVILGGYSLSALVAVGWAVIMSLRPMREVFTYGAWALPRQWAWQNYADAWRQLRVGTYFANSIVYSVGGTVGVVMLSAGVAYVLARVELPGKRAVYYLFLASLMVPEFLAMVPRYFLMKRLGLVDTYLVIMLLSWAGRLSFNVFLLVSFFETLPVELEEAAFVDGASPWQIFWRVMFPLARPGLATVAIFTFIGTWNEFMTPLIYLRSPSRWPLSLGLQMLSFTALLSGKHTTLFAGLVIFMLPPLMVYFVLKDRITEGLTVGALKG